MDGNTLLDAFDISIRVENCLIQASKIAPRPPMPFFSEIQPSIPFQIPPIAIVPDILTSPYQAIPQEKAILDPSK